MLVLILPWVGYGWGYRKWGPPYPRYIQQRRINTGGPSAIRYDAWGWHGDAIWGIFLVATFWFLTASYWWR